MDFLNTSVKKIYFKYLSAAFGSALSFLILPFNIFSTYYFQSIMKPKAAFIVSVFRGLVISGILILVLPLLFGAESLWLAMPLTEVLVMFYVAARIKKYTADFEK